MYQRRHIVSVIAFFLPYIEYVVEGEEGVDEPLKGRVTSELSVVTSSPMDEIDNIAPSHGKASSHVDAEDSQGRSYKLEACPACICNNGFSECPSFRSLEPWEEQR